MLKKLATLTICTLTLTACASTYTPHKPGEKQQCRSLSIQLQEMNSAGANTFSQRMAYNRNNQEYKALHCSQTITWGEKGK